MQGETVSYRFDQDGVYPYSCLIHPGMVGAIVVGDGVGTDPAGVVPVTTTQVSPPVAEGGAVNGILAWITAAALLLAGVSVVYTIADRRKRTVAG
jgi:hypothetical protein